MPRSRWIYLLLVLIVIGLGLGIRKLGISGFMGDHIPDALWGLMVFFGFGLLFPKNKIYSNALLAALFAVAIEVSGFYQGEWFLAIKDTLPGRLVFGYDFSWIDLIRYGCGIASGVVIESISKRAH